VAISSSVSLELNRESRSASILHCSNVAIAAARFSLNVELLLSRDVSTASRLISADLNSVLMLCSVILSGYRVEMSAKNVKWTRLAGLGHGRDFCHFGYSFRLSESNILQRTHM
jgi:hypothetical protein